MSYKLKTLIVFDTNSLRSTDAGEVVYSSFSFGKAYDVINGFIEENKLQNDVFVAVSGMVVDEIKIQMERSYKADLQKLGDTKRRMNGLPHVTTELIGIPDSSFNCYDFVEQKATEYLDKHKHVRLLTYNDDQSEQILKSLIERVYKTNPPFFKTTKNSDAGFKDSVIWETLLNYKEIEQFNKVILVTRDEGFKGCEAEFIARWNKHFKIISSPEAVNIELTLDYDNYLKERAIYDFTQTEYFGNYLGDQLKGISLIVKADKEFSIENFAITDLCVKAIRLAPNEDGIENIIILSEIKIFYSDDGEKKEQIVKVETTLFDETKEIESTTFNYEIK